MSRNLAEHGEFLALLGSHERHLLKVCWVYGQSVHDRDDLLQEIVSQLWNSFGRYDRARKFSTWMYRVALNVAIDHERRRRRWGRDGKGGGVEAMVDRQADGGNDEQFRELREMLGRLCDADRAILLLYLDGNSYREIGEIVGISETNVGTRIGRLKSAMRASAASSEGELQ